MWDIVCVILSASGSNTTTKKHLWRQTTCVISWGFFFFSFNYVKCLLRAGEDTVPRCKWWYASVVSVLIVCPPEGDGMRGGEAVDDDEV